jgi:VWFA-related protein
MTAGTRRLAYGASIVCAAGILAAVAPTVHAVAEPGVQTIYVTVLDKKGAPVLDLKGTDFSVREDGEKREVVRAAVTETPLQIALMMDDAGTSSGSLGRSVKTFSDELRDHADVTVTTWQRRDVEMLDFINAGDDSPDGLKPMYTTSGQAPHLLERSLEASQAFLKREAAHPVIVAITSATEDAGNVRLSDLSDSLARSGTQLYVVNLAPQDISGIAGSDLHGSDTPTAGAGIARPDSAFGDAPERTGGRTDRVVSMTGLPTVLQQLATELAHQYALDYRVAAGHADAKLAVDVQRKDVKLRAPRRVIHAN